MSDEAPEKPGGLAPPPVATRWKPGQSGNPKGRPPVKRVRAAIKKFKYDAFDGLQAGLKAGESWAVTLWFHYFYGKPAEKLEHTGAEGEAISIIINRTVKPEGEL